MSKNTVLEMYDDNVASENAPMTQDEILMNEKNILSGMLEAGKATDNGENYRKIQIKRQGKLLFEFRIRPITEDENQTCWRRATKYAQTKPGQPKVAIETNNAKYRSYVIYTATVDEDRAKVWDNKAAKDAFNILDSVEMIDKVLLAGEKSRILDIIDEISGFDEEATEELAKNS